MALTNAQQFIPAERLHKWPVGTFTGGLQRLVTPRRWLTYITNTETPGVPPFLNLEDDVGLRNGAPTLVGGHL